MSSFAAADVWRAAFAAAALTSLVSGCGQSAGERPTPTATPASVYLPACAAVQIPRATAAPGASLTPPSSVSVVTVTTADGGATVFLTTGQMLVVEAGFPGWPAPGGTPRTAGVYWDAPIAASAGPLRRQATQTCPGGAALALFEAVATGSTPVVATTDAPCLHVVPSCEIPQQVIQIRVVVRGA